MGGALWVQCPWGWCGGLEFIRREGGNTARCVQWRVHMDSGENGSGEEDGPRTESKQRHRGQRRR